MTLILRIKFHEIEHMDKVMDYVKNNLKCRVNEEEGLLIDEDKGRSGSVKLTSSSDAGSTPNGKVKDML